MKSTIITAFAIALWLTSLAPRSALAQVSSSHVRMDDDLIWPQGKTEDARAQASEFYQAGNDYMSKLRFDAAEVKYVNALEYWRHPVVLYRLALTRIQLEKKVAAYENLVEALQYGDAPFDMDTYLQAVSEEKKLRAEIAEIEIVCEQPGATIVLDGQSLATDGTAETQCVVRRYLLPGEHRVGAVKEGYESLDQRVVLAAGERKTVTLRLFTTEELTKAKRRVWGGTQWTVLGAGVVAGLAGLYAYDRAGERMDSFGQALSAVCPQGCAPDHERFPQDRLNQAQDAALNSQVIFTMAATTVLASAVLFYVNRSRSYRVDRSDESVRIRVQPMLAPHALGAGMGVSF